MNTNSSNILKTISALGVGLAGMLFSTDAFAASGNVRGYWTFTQQTAGYCNTATMDCTGSRYTDAEFSSNEPLQNARVEIRDASFNLLGSCSTSTSGYYDCPWTAASMPSEVRVYFRFEDKQQRFIVYQDDGTSRWYYYVNASTVNGIQNIGTYNIPAYGFMSLYDVMQRSYYSFVGTSGLMQSRFTGIKVLYDHPDDGGWADGPNKTIQMGWNRTNTINAAHEAGHIADYLAKPRDSHNGWSYNGNSGHSPTSLEYRGFALSEALADLVAVGAYWSGTAPEPRLCMYNTTGPCTSNADSHMEVANGSCSTTNANNSRTRVATTRYLWDVIDSNDDGETLDAFLYDIYEMLDDLPAGTSWGQADSASGNTESFHQYEFEWQLDALRSVDSLSVYYKNCMGYF